MTQTGQTPAPSSGRHRRPLLVFVGTRIRQLREERGWSQGKLAALVGVSQSLLAKYESGFTEPPLRTLLRLAHTLEAPLGLLADERYGEEPVGDAALLSRLRQISALPPKDRAALLDLLDVFLNLRRLVGREGEGDRGAR